MSTFLIRDDEIQVDKAIYALRVRLLLLKRERDDLWRENQKLLNAQDPPVTDEGRSIIVTYKKPRIDLSIPVDKWKTPHFIKYFQTLYEAKYQIPYKVKGNQWGVFAIRLDTFRKSHSFELSDNAVFKEYFDWLFIHKFTRQYVATIQVCSSEVLFSQWAISQNKGINKVKKIAALPPTAKDSKEFDDVLEDAF